MKIVSFGFVVTQDCKVANKIITNGIRVVTTVLHQYMVQPSTASCTISEAVVGCNKRLMIMELIALTRKSFFCKQVSRIKRSIKQL